MLVAYSTGSSSSNELAAALAVARIDARAAADADDDDPCLVPAAAEGTGVAVPLVTDAGAKAGVDGVAPRLGDMGVARPDADDDAPPPAPPLPSADATLSRLAVAAAALRGVEMLK
jgi:hypothetical protein